MSELQGIRFHVKVTLDHIGMLKKPFSKIDSVTQRLRIGSTLSKRRYKEMSINVQVACLEFFSGEGKCVCHI